MRKIRCRFIQVESGDDDTLKLGHIADPMMPGGHNWGEICKS